jgi:hypothetical protein
MTEKQFQPGQHHPDQYAQDLNPDEGAGQNHDNMAIGADADVRNAYEIKGIHRQFHGFTDDELKRIPVVPRGERLAQGAVYVDLNDPQLREITATGDMSAGEYQWYVPKREVDYQLWNRLIGITNPERLGDADDS